MFNHFISIALSQSCARVFRKLLCAYEISAQISWTSSNNVLECAYKSKPTGSFSLFLSDTGSELFLHILKQKSACI